MTESTNRRTLLGTIVGVAVLSGCVGDVDYEDSSNDNEDEFAGTAENELEDSEEIEASGEIRDSGEVEDSEAARDSEEVEEELTEEEIVRLFDATLEQEGIETESVDRVDDVLEVAYNATGMTDEAVVSEIETIADVYVRAVNTGLTTDRLEAFVQDPEGGTIIDSFVIETEWVEAYLNEEIEWNEYIERIVETFESTDTDD